MFYFSVVSFTVCVKVCVFVRYSSVVCVVNVCLRYFSVVGSQHDPATEAVAHIDCSSAAAEADDVWKCSSQGHDQDLRTHAHTHSVC